MRSRLFRRTPARCRPRLLLALAFLCCLISTGCLRATNETKVEHVFVGDAPVTGAVQVASNKPIPIVSVDAQGLPHYEERDCGQFVLIPPHIYRDLRARLAAQR